MSALILCLLCQGTGDAESLWCTRSRDGECPCCKGFKKVRLEHVPDEDLHLFADVAGIRAELTRRGCVALVVDCAGHVMPGTAEDIANGCEPIVARPGLRRASTPPAGMPVVKVA